MVTAIQWFMTALQADTHKYLRNGPNKMVNFQNLTHPTSSPLCQRPQSRRLLSILLRSLRMTANVGRAVACLFLPPEAMSLSPELRNNEQALPGLYRTTTPSPVLTDTPFRLRPPDNKKITPL